MSFTVQIKASSLNGAVKKQLTRILLMLKGPAPKWPLWHNQVNSYNDSEWCLQTLFKLLLKPYKHGLGFLITGKFECDKSCSAVTTNSQQVARLTYIKKRAGRVCFVCLTLCLYLVSFWLICTDSAGATEAQSAPEFTRFYADDTFLRWIPNSASADIC